jgi:predicted DNA-binding protein
MTKTEKTVVLGIRIPVSLRDRIDVLAGDETRTRVNLIHVLLEEAVTAREHACKGKKS